MNSSLVLTAPTTPAARTPFGISLSDLSAARGLAPLALSASALLLTTLLAWIATSGLLAPLGFPGELLLSGAIYPGAAAFWLLLGLPAIGDGLQILGRLGKSGSASEGVAGFTSIALALLSLVPITRIAAAI